MIDVVIHWTGPHSLFDDRKKLSVQSLDNMSSDRGLYQIYTQHPVYGRSLVYIGKACNQTFAKRVAQHNWALGSELDPDNIEVYVGRWTVNSHFEFSTWAAEVSAAEHLLIHSHGLAFNAALVRDGPSVETCGDMRVLNFGACRSLNREVSGTMWTQSGNHYRARSYLEIPQK